MNNFEKIGQMLSEKAKIDGRLENYMTKHRTKSEEYHQLPVFRMAAAEVVRRGYNTTGLLKEAGIQKKALTQEYLAAGFEVSDNDVYKLHRVGWFGAKYRALDDDFLEYEASKPRKGVTTSGFLTFLEGKYEPKAKEWTIKFTAEGELKGSDEAKEMLEALIEERIQAAIAG